MKVLSVNEQTSLRQIQCQDAEAIFTIIDQQREYLGKWLPFVAYTHEIGDTEKFVDSVVQAPESLFELVFTIRWEDDLIGIIGFKLTDKANKKTEIGYWLSEPFQGKGIMTMSVIKLCEYAFTELDMNRIQIKCAVGNQPSSSIPRKLGFKLEGIERDGELLSNGSFTDIEVYSLLKNEFQRGE